ncbi:MAG: protease modulator HflK, partial [Candidatus Omnitrophica bacterium]|nr:protease modulator HflK [Candidatus Omnitrophota bacterium]
GKSQIESDILEFGQELVDRFELGVEIQTVNLVEAQPPDAVQNAFKDVISAKEEKQEEINKAKGYENGEIPRAEGQAASLINEASGYYQERVLTAQGEIQKYSALLKEYRLSEEVTRYRLYLETMDEIFERADYTLIDKNLANILPMLHLSEEQVKPTKRVAPTVEETRNQTQ